MKDNLDDVYSYDVLNNTPNDDYRAQCKAEMNRMCEETGLSKRQIRKRERRRIETQRKNIIKQSYPKCANCQQPSSKNCCNLSCKRCCYLTCIQLNSSCKGWKVEINFYILYLYFSVHGFDHLKISKRRENSANELGITLDELFTKETVELEQRKFLKNGKKFNFNLNITNDSKS